MNRRTQHKEEIKDREVAAVRAEPLRVETDAWRDDFGTFATWTARMLGGRAAFAIAFLVVVGWLISGPFFGFSSVWQLVINTATTIVTFLMVFLLQNSQNRESKAIHLKLDELILALKRADNRLISVEALTEKQLDQIAERYRDLGQGLRQEDQDACTEAETSNPLKQPGPTPVGK